MADSVSTSGLSGETRRPRTILDFALYYANEGLRVLPLHSARSPDSCSCGRANCSSVGKHPRTQKGVKEATCDRQQIKEWWRRYPDANVGIATGDGLLVGGWNVLIPLHRPIHDQCSICSIILIPPDKCTAIYC